jgi:signal transduction histidine kinase
MLCLVTLVLLGLGIPLALSVSGSEQQQMFLDRLTVTERLASLAQRPLLDGEYGELAKVLQRYSEVYGITSAVLDQDGALRASAPTAPQLNQPAIAAALNDALADRQPEPGAVFVPWDSDPMVLAEPVMVDGEVRGAVVTVSPTDALRARVLDRWAVVAAGGVVALALAILLALPVVRWILVPIRRLDEAAGRVAEAVAGEGTFSPVAVSTGPPELRQLARSFDGMAGTVADVLAAQRAFVADASHQLRNPLTALSIRLRNLEGMVDPDAVEDYAETISETQRLNEVLDSLLALARAEAAPATPVRIDTSADLRERVEAWRAVAAARDVVLDSDIGEGLSVLAVPRAVDHVLDALLDNAVKYSAGVDGARVEVVAGRAGDVVSISVRDNGPGLDEAQLDRATDRFWRGPAHQNISGSGLGLAIVKHIVDRSAGTLRTDLPEGGGLRVTVELPYHELT